jgi:A/G-specific adenine glycosylase
MTAIINISLLKSHDTHFFMQNDKHSIAPTLLQWFDLHGRKDLPWQHNKTPYRVWVSEIMLQQTQVSSVIHYYQRFMASFANIEALADAEEDQVLEHWAGLGYYARARNLHKTAKLIMRQYDGEFPSELDALVALPGIGRSTAGAILSIAMQTPTSILDGNVKRVLARYYAIHTWPGERKTEKTLWNYADLHTPKQRADDYTQAIMDLGATLCKRSKPRCIDCPLTLDCSAYEQALTHKLPVSKPKKILPTKERWFLEIRDANNQLLLERRPSKGIWGGLYSLPELSDTQGLFDVEQALRMRFNLTLIEMEEQASFKHTFSHYHLIIKPVRIVVCDKSNNAQEAKGLWYEQSTLNNLGLPAPIKKYLSR